MVVQPGGNSRPVAGPRFGAALLVAALSVCAPLVPVERSATAQRLDGDLPRTRVQALAAGKCLVAGRNLQDPNFNESVVLLAQFGPEGAMGLIINAPTEVPVARVLAEFRGSRGRSEAVYFGGPVASTDVMALRRARSAVAESRRILDEVHLITTREPLEAALASGAEPDALRVYLGYAGWGAGQLERETALGAWHVVSADADLVFDPEPESLWRRQIRRTERLQIVRQRVSPRPLLESAVHAARVEREGPVGLRAQPDAEP